MGMARRVLLFIGLNLIIVLTISFILSVFHVQPFLTSRGMNLGSLMAFCLIWGMGGAFISLALSRKMAKWMLGVKLVDPDTATGHERELLDRVYALAKSANLAAMPEVGIYASPEINAFATGPSQRRSLVAVSSGLLQRLSREEQEGVLGHEVAHIANGDMVTMTLIQGVVNAFVMFLARVLAAAVSGLGQNNRDRSSSSSYGVYMVSVFLFEIVFMLLGSMVVAVYSRFREYRADRGGASLAGKPKMLAALEALKRHQELALAPEASGTKPVFNAMKISGGKRRNVLQLFSTHPPLEKRIARLQECVV